MRGEMLPPAGTELLRVARLQHGVVTRPQLLELGYSPKAIEHRIAKRILHRVRRGIYAVGRPQLTIHGHWMAAVLSCGPEAALSHLSAAALWRIRPSSSNPIEVTVPRSVGPRRPGITVHRRPTFVAADVTRNHAIPVTTPICTLIDIANFVRSDQ